MLLKGVLTAEDAELAVAAGAAGVIVSNHGGRQLDSVPAAIDALPEVAAAVRGRVPVLVDGGFRRGSDVLVALALGASAVMIGRRACSPLLADPFLCSLCALLLTIAASCVSTHQHPLAAFLLRRPVLWGLALRGEEGVSTVLEMLKRELQLSLRLAGCPALRDVTRERVRHETEVLAGAAGARARL